MKCIRTAMNQVAPCYPVPLREQRAEIVRRKTEAEGLEPFATERQIGLETEVAAFCRSVLPDLDKNLKRLADPDSNPQGIVTLGEVDLSDIGTFQETLKVLDVGSLKALKKAVESQGTSLSLSFSSSPPTAGRIPVRAQSEAPSKEAATLVLGNYSRITLLETYYLNFIGNMV